MVRSGERHWRRWTGIAVVVLLVLGSGVGQSQRARKVLIVYDLEGVTASVEGGDYNIRHANYAKIRESLAEDVNAVVHGLQKAGATEIVIVDCHASGNAKEADFPTDKLLPGVRMDVRDRSFDPYVDAIDPSYDALVMVGMHGRSGSRGFSPHTYFGNTRWHLNDVNMSETSMVAYSAARFRVPLILVTGDDVHKEEVAEFSNAEYVIVKKSSSAREAVSRPRAVVSREIQEAAERGFRKAATYKLTEVSAPIVSRFSFSLDDQVALAVNYPGVTLVDNRTVSLVTANYLDALLAYRTLSVFLNAANAATLMSAVNQTEGGAELVQKAREKMPQRRWEATADRIDLGSMNKLDRYGYR